MKLLEPTSSNLNINFPVDAPDTEFEVHAYLYWALRSAGFNVRGEVNWKHPDSRERCRFDLIIYEGSRPAHIVEIKARPVNHKTCVENTRQGRRYRLFGIPVTFVYGKDDADEFMRYAFGGKLRWPS